MVKKWGRKLLRYMGTLTKAPKREKRDITGEKPAIE